MRTCDGCREYRTALRGMRRSFAALSPVGVGPLAMAGAKLLGLGGAGGGAAAGGAAAAGGGAAAAGGVATVTACKVAAVVCTAALTAAGGAVEVSHLTRDHRDAPARAAKVAAPRREGVQRGGRRTADRLRAVVGRRSADRRRHEAADGQAAAREGAGRGAAREGPGRRGRAGGRRRPITGGAQAPPAAGEEPAAVDEPAAGGERPGHGRRAGRAAARGPSPTPTGGHRRPPSPAPSTPPTEH